MPISGITPTVYNNFQNFLDSSCEQKKPIIKKVNMNEESRKNIQAISAAAVFYSLSNIIANPVIKYIINPFIKDDANLGIKLEDVLKEVNKMDENYGLDKKGFKWCIAPKNIPNGISENEKFLYEAERKLAKMGGDGIFIIKNFIIAGNKGSFFEFMANSALVIEEKASFIFHEMGHAVQKLNSKIGSLLQKLRVDRTINLFKGKLAIPFYAITSAAIMAAGLGHKNQDTSENTKQENTFNKITGFVKKHAGMLTLATFAPMLLDEGFATKHALKSLKESGSKMFAPVGKNYGFAYLTYATIAAFNIIGVKGAILLKDKMTKDSLLCSE